MSENNINNPENINKICYELNDEALAINLNELEESKSPRGPSNTNLDLKEDFIIKIISIDEKKIDLTVSDTTSILEIKNSLLETTEVPINRQRLIFRGKLLEDSKKVKDYGISNADVVHFIAKINEATVDNSSQSSNHINLNRREPRSNFFLLPNQSFLPFFNLSRRRIINSQNNSGDTLTSLLQSNYTLSSMLNNKNFTDNIQELNRPIDFVNFETRHFTKGQWVDVKDTVNQWLEAEIIDIQEVNENRLNSYYRGTAITNYDEEYRRFPITDTIFNSFSNVNSNLNCSNKVVLVKVHYIGWGDNWDEWILSKSRRIMPFRFYTQEKYRYRCCPSAKTINSSDNFHKKLFSEIINLNNMISKDKNLLYNNNNIEEDEISTCDINLTELLKSYSIYIDTLQHKISHLENLKKEMKYDQSEELNKQVILNNQSSYYITLKTMIPLLDRLGRSFVDLASFADKNIKKNDLEKLEPDFFKVLSSPLKPLHRSTRLTYNIDSNISSMIVETNNLDKELNNSIPLLKIHEENNFLDNEIDSFDRFSTIHIERLERNNNRRSNIHIFGERLHPELEVRPRNIIQREPRINEYTNLEVSNTNFSLKTNSDKIEKNKIKFNINQKNESESLNLTKSISISNNNKINSNINYNTSISNNKKNSIKSNSYDKSSLTATFSENSNDSDHFEKNLEKKSNEKINLKQRDPCATPMISKKENFATFDLFCSNSESSNRSNIFIQKKRKKNK